MKIIMKYTIVRDAFIGGGADAMSCDLLPTEIPGPHYQGDKRNRKTDINNPGPMA